MALTFYGNLDLDQQELQNVSLEKKGAIISSTDDDYEGRIIFVQSDQGDSTLAGTIQYKNIPAGETPATGTTGWINLTGEGAITSVMVHSTQGGLKATYDAADDSQRVDIDYDTGNNLIKAAGVGSNNVFNASLNLTDQYMLTGISGEDAKKATLLKVKTAISAGVGKISKVTGAGVGDSHLDITDADPTSGLLAEYGTAGAGGLQWQLKLGAGDAIAIHGSTVAATLFLKATGPNSSVWAPYQQYYDNTYLFDVEQVIPSSVANKEYARIRLMESVNGAAYAASDTINLEPKLTGGGDSKELQFLVTNTGAASQLAKIQVKLNAAAQIAGNAQSIVGTYGGGLSMPTTTKSATIAGNFTSTSATAASFPSAADTHWVAIDKVYADYNAAPDPAMMANRDYVEGVLTAIGAGGSPIVFKGSYSAAATDPPTGTSVLEGHLYVVTAAGKGAADGSFFWSLLLNQGDMIMCNTTNPQDENDWNVLQGNIDIASQTVAGLCRFPGESEGALDGGWAPVGDWGEDGEPRLKGYALSWPVATDVDWTENSMTLNVTKHGRISSRADAPIAFANATDISADGNAHVPAFGDDIGTLVYNKQRKVTVPDAAGSYAITHSLGTKDVIVDVCTADTGENVFAEVVRTSINVVTLTVSGNHVQDTFQVTLNALS